MFVLTKACSCIQELAYFAGKIDKNRLVCKNAVAFAHYGSCRLPVMCSWHDLMMSSLVLLMMEKLKHMK